MLNILTNVTSGINVEEFITLIESIDTTMLGEQITRIGNWIIGILATVGGTIALIVHRYQKLKAKFEAINWKEKGDTQLKQDTIKEMMDIANETKQTVANTYNETKTEIEVFKQDSAILKEMLPLMIKGGTFDSETLMALGSVAERFAEGTSVITETFKEELEKQIELTNDTTSLLDE